MLSSNTSGVSEDANYIESVFSTYLYTGNSASRTITNNIDLSTKGGAVFFGGRNVGTNKSVYDTARGATYDICTNLTQQQIARTTALTGFTTSGFTLGADAATEAVNLSGTNYVSWTFRKQPKFFDVVTYTGTGSPQSIAHSLGSTPGCIIVKKLSATSEWWVYHKDATVYGLPPRFCATLLNSTAGTGQYSTIWNETDPTSTAFTVGSSSDINASGATFVAYIFAHNAGGFGLTGTDNVISCGSFTASANSATVNLGYEPQWLLCKNANSAEDWFIYDTMRGWSFSAENRLVPNTSAAEVNDGTSSTVYFVPTATGFEIKNYVNNNTYIYIAIRRGPMKVPTDATKVFKTITYSGTNSAGQIISGAGFSPDFALAKARSTDSGFHQTWMDRLRGGTAYLFSDTTSAEGNTGGYYIRSFDMDGVTYGTAYGDYTNASATYAVQFLKRAPSFFDEVCYTGTGANRTVTHNLGVAPEMILFKRRDASAQWQFYFAGIGNTKSVQMPDNDKVTSVAMFNNTSPTSSEFTVGISSTVNASGGTYVAYLAATCAGVSKVGTYTGTGTTQQINCGFTSGARFVLIKNVGVNDYAYGYYLWDSARGIVAGNDPYLLLSSTAAEVTSTDYIDPLSTGFEISSTAPVGINENGAQFVYWAIA